MGFWDRQIKEIKKERWKESPAAFQYAITRNAKRKSKADVRKEIEEKLADFKLQRAESEK